LQRYRPTSLRPANDLARGFCSNEPALGAPASLPASRNASGLEIAGKDAGAPRFMALIVSKWERFSRPMNRSFRRKDADATPLR